MTAQPAAAVAPNLSPPRNSVAHDWMTSPVYQLLELAAERRSEQHPDRLAARILDVVLRNGLVDALLDP